VEPWTAVVGGTSRPVNFFFHQISCLFSVLLSLLVVLDDQGFSCMHRDYRTRLKSTGLDKIRERSLFHEYCLFVYHVSRLNKLTHTRLLDLSVISPRNSRS
jgi:hypothetical protein